jgi:RNase P protein component
MTLYLLKKVNKCISIGDNNSLLIQNSDSIGNGENEEDQEIYLTNNGLTAGQIRSLVAVSKMLTKSPKLKNAVDGNYIRKQRYTSMQAMNQEAYDECANLVNLLRTISPTTDDRDCSVLKFIQM